MLFEIVSQLIVQVPVKITHLLFMSGITLVVSISKLTSWIDTRFRGNMISQLYMGVLNNDYILVATVYLNRSVHLQGSWYDPEIRLHASKWIG